MFEDGDEEVCLRIDTRLDVGIMFAGTFCAPSSDFIAVAVILSCTLQDGRPERYHVEAPEP